jgi:hypothetical protein
VAHPASCPRARERSYRGAGVQPGWRGIENIRQDRRDGIVDADGLVLPRWEQVAIDVHRRFERGMAKEGLEPLRCCLLFDHN